MVRRSGQGKSVRSRTILASADPGSSPWRIDSRSRRPADRRFAQTDFKITDHLKLTTGVRSRATSWISVRTTRVREQPERADGPARPGAAAAVFHGGAEFERERHDAGAGLSYEIDDNNMVYTTAAKGFAPAGANQQVPITCNRGPARPSDTQIRVAIPFNR